MDLRALRYFLAVYEELSLSGAARRCFVSQPSMSAALQQLEGELDRQLFVRHAKGVTPTQAGDQLYPYARKVLDDIQSIQGFFREPRPHIPFKLAIMPFLSGQNISMIVKALLDMVTGLDLTIVDLNEEADARIVSSELVGPDEAFHKLWRDEFVLALPLHHPLAALGTVTLAMLDKAPFISRQPCDVIDAWMFATQKSGIAVDTKATVRTEEYALDLVAAGLGISVIPSHSIGLRADIATCGIRDLKLERVVGLAYRKAHPLPDRFITAVNGVRQRLPVAPLGERKT